MSIPSLTIRERVKEDIRKITRKIAKALHIQGPFNIQYLVKDDQAFVIECNLRSSRSMPFVSKTIGTNLMDLAASAMLSEKVDEGEGHAQKFCVKSPQFSFMRLEGADPVTGVEMLSTGEVACFGDSFEEALLKSMVASGVRLPRSGDSILISVGGQKAKAVEIAQKIANNGYTILATEHTAEALRENGIQCRRIYKISERKTPNVLDFLRTRRLNFVINTPHPQKIDWQAITDGYLIRRKAVELGIPLITNLELATSLASALQNHFGDLENLENASMCCEKKEG